MYLSNPITATTTPSQPVINSFTNVTVSTITVGWTGGLGATSYIYYFNGVPIIPSIDNGTTNKTATFTGLNPDTFYTIIVVGGIYAVIKLWTNTKFHDLPKDKDNRPDEF